MATYSYNAPVYIPNTGLNPQPGMIDDSNAQTTSDGFKYVYAGTPVGGSTNFLTSQQPVILQPTNDPSKVQGVVMTDQDITNGPVNCAVLTAGTLNRHAMQPQLQSIYSEQFIQGLKSSTPGLQVVDKSWK